MAKISKEQIRQRLQGQKAVSKKPVKKKSSPDQKKREPSSLLFKDLRNLGLVTSVIIVLLVTVVVIKTQTEVFGQASNYIFSLLNFS